MDAENPSTVRSRGVGMLLLALLSGLCPADSGAGADRSLDRLIDAVARLRGVGYPEVGSYRVELTLPDEPDEDTISLREIWRSPGDLALRAARPETPPAMVRSLALYLEPLYVARSSFLAVDLDTFRARIERSGHVSTSEATPGEGERIAIRLPEGADSARSDLESDLSGIDAELDRKGRLRTLTLHLREGAPDGGPARMHLACDYAGAPLAPQPGYATWELPSGDTVEIRTEFREEGEVRVPASRHVLFPSRYDPGEMEEIHVRYGRYELDVVFPEDAFRGPGTFRFDAFGLVPDSQ
jgi:hypothetical protein